MENRIQQNARDLEQELAWLARVLDARFKLYFGQECEHQHISEISPPDLKDSKSQYAQFTRHYKFGFAERLAVILSLTPHIRPQLLDVFFVKNKTFDRKFTEFGGVRSNSEGDFHPTGETLLFVLAANDLEARFELQALFDPEHFFTKHNILRLEPSPTDFSPLKSPLKISEEYLSLFTIGHSHRPTFGANFPAQFIETRRTWDDLVLHPGTLEQIDEIRTWVEHNETLMRDWEMAPKLRPGYRSLFYGPPGTGKTMTACLLGKSTGREVYKIDLSMVVSKYIGETEKNLAKVFDQAQHKHWILFFDEADALFGKRTLTKDAHDRYANQEVSFLLQRIETFDGIAILSSNLRENLDDAFARRFESLIYFPIPNQEDRLRLWKQGFSPKIELESSLDLEKIAQDYELSGGSIMNVVSYASLQALKNGASAVAAKDVLRGIRREFAKEGREI